MTTIQFISRKAKSLGLTVDGIINPVTAKEANARDSILVSLVKELGVYPDEAADYMNVTKQHAWQLMKESGCPIYKS